jgi:hypothetical protein
MNYLNRLQIIRMDFQASFPATMLLFLTVPILMYT